MLKTEIVPWPEYGDRGAAVWRVLVDAPGRRVPTRRYWLSYSTRLGRLSKSKDAEDLAAVVGRSAVFEVEQWVRGCVDPLLS